MKNIIFLGSILVMAGLVSCKRSLQVFGGMGREFPGLTEKTFKKISRETRVPMSSIVLPDKQAIVEIYSQLSKNKMAYPFVFLLNEKRELVVMPDTLSQNQCIGLLEKYLVAGPDIKSTGKKVKGNFLHFADSTAHSFQQEKNYLVLAYLYEMGKTYKRFYRRVGKMADDPAKNLQMFLVVLNRE